MTAWWEASAEEYMNRGGPYECGSVSHLRSLFTDLAAHVAFDDPENGEEARAIMAGIQHALGLMDGGSA